MEAEGELLMSDEYNVAKKHDNTLDSCCEPEEFYVDIHCHSTLVPYNKTKPEDRDRDDEEKSKKAPENFWLHQSLDSDEQRKKGASGVTYTQSDFIYLRDGHVRVIFASLYPIEQGFLSARVIGKSWITDMIANKWVVGFPSERINEIQSEDHDYFDDLKKEYEFLVRGINSEKQDEMPNIVIAKDGDFNNNEMVNNQDNDIMVVLTIEGGHSLGCGQRNTRLKKRFDELSDGKKDDAEMNTVSELLARLEKNIKALKQWGNEDHCPLFITLSHHFWNQLAGHSISISGFGKRFVLNQKKGRNEGMTEIGKKIVDLLLSKENGKRILIDTKHISIEAKKWYYPYIEGYNIENPDDKIPIISSHSAVNGYKTMEDSTENNDKNRQADRKYKRDSNIFNNWDINLSDEEIRIIGRSGGLIGINFDQRILSGKKMIDEIEKKMKDIDSKKYKDKKELRTIWAEPILHNILHIAKVLEDGGYEKWDHVAIGSDFDGMINPLDEFCVAEDFCSLEKTLKKTMKLLRDKKDIPLLEDKNFQLLNNMKDEKIDEIVDNFMYKNAIKFLKKHFNREKVITDKIKPDIIIDSHMHIMSGHCTPLPLLWGLRGIVDFLKPGRKVLDAFSPLLGLGTQIYSTKRIGKKAVKKNQRTYKKFQEEYKEYQERELLTPMVVLTMDMEYAHIYGYEGIPIYHKRRDKAGIFWTKRSFRKQGSEVKIKEKPIDMGEISNGVSTNHIVKKVIGKVGKGAWIAGKKLVGGEVINFDVILDRAIKSSTGIVGIAIKAATSTVSSIVHYTDWNKQIKQTIEAVVNHPCKLLPMYHYEPRRWQGDTIKEIVIEEPDLGLIDDGQEKEKITLKVDELEVSKSIDTGKKKKYIKGKIFSWDTPFNNIATTDSEGLFIGFKMYTALGYKPLDPKLPHLHNFYKRCEEKQIPVINHCTPGGSYTHEREFYLDIEEDEDTAKKYRDRIKKLSKNKQIKNERIRYFQDNFVRPSAWKEVLKNYPKLKLCLAHFGGDEKDYLKKYKDCVEWREEIIDMIKNHSNFYTDISYVFFPPKKKDNEDYRNKFKDALKQHHDIKNKILFGTDWYLVKMDIKGKDKKSSEYHRYCVESKEFLDKIGEELEEDLWTRFTCFNPIHFLRLDDKGKLENLKKALKNHGADESEVNDGYDKITKLVESGEYKRYLQNLKQ